MKTARDTWLTFGYEAGQLVHNPAAVGAALLNPVTFLLFFTPFLKSVMHASSYGDAYRIYVPLLFCTQGLFAGLFAGLVLLSAVRQGVISRYRVTPLSRVGLLLGRELVVVAMIGFQALVITAIALVFGLRVAPVSFLLALIVLAMMVLVGVSISYAVALAFPNETVLPSVLNGVAQPLSLLAGVLIPLSVAPLWVQDAALWNPWAWAAKSMRAIFDGHVGAQVVWQAGLILAVLAAVTLVLSSRLFTREIA